MLSENMSDDELLPSSESGSHRKSVRGVSQSSNEIIKAFQVNAFQYVDGKYENKGKLGLAILGSKVTKTFNLLLYGKGSVPVTQAYINSDFNITSAKELYFSFYDMKSDNWSIIFETNELFKDFTCRMCMCKMLVSKLDFVYIDMKSGDGLHCQESDLCEIELIVNSISNCDIASTIYTSHDQDNSKIVRTKVGTNKLPPVVEKCLIGMSKGGCRIIAVSSKGSMNKCGSSVKFSFVNDVLIHVKLVRIKSRSDKSTTLSDLGDTEITLPNLNFDNKSELDQVESKKSELISRMAKMGKSIVGFNPPETGSVPEPVLASKPTSNSYQQSNNQQMFNNYTPNPNVYMPSPIATQILPFQSQAQFYPNISQNIPQIQNNPVNDFSILFTETRQNNTEMRIAMGKIQDKVDKIIEKIESNSHNSKQLVTRHLDAESVYSNIKRILDENETLKQDCSQKNETIDSLNKRINDLLKKSQQYLEESHGVLERNSISFSSNVTEHQNKILQLEEEKLNLIRNLSQKTSELSRIEVKLESSLSDSSNYKSKSVEYSEQLNRMTDELNDLKLKNRAIITELNELKESKKTDKLNETELEFLKEELISNERRYKQKIEDLRKIINQNNSKLEIIKTEYDADIYELRDVHAKEVDDLKNRIKAERQKLNSKNSDYDNELKVSCHNWEQTFDEFRQSEALKLSKIGEKNSQLMIENANLNRELIETKERLSLLISNQSSESQSLLSKNQQLREDNSQLMSSQSELKEENSRLSSLENEIKRVNFENKHLKYIKTEFDLLKEENYDITKQYEELKRLNNLNSDIKSGSGELESVLKNIMNDIFKKIKDDFEVDEKYSGKDALSKCMVIIRDSTMLILKKKTDEETDSYDEDNSTDEDISEGEEETQSSELSSKTIQLTTGYIHSEIVENVDASLKTIANTSTTDKQIDESSTSLILSDMHIKGDISTNNEFENVNNTVLNSDEHLSVQDNNQEPIHIGQSIEHVESKVGFNLESKNDTNDKCDDDKLMYVQLEVTNAIVDTNIVEKVDDAQKYASPEEVEILGSEIVEDKLTEIESPITGENVDCNSKTEDPDSIDQVLIGLEAKTSLDNVVKHVETLSTEEPAMKKVDPLFSSDEEDVDDFLQQLGVKKKLDDQKKPIALPITKTAYLDNELSWLNG